MRPVLLLALWLGTLCLSATAQTPATPATPAAPVPPYVAERRMPPAYPVPYAPATPEEISAVLGRILGYLETASPVLVIDADTGRPAPDLAHLPKTPALDFGAFMITTYEWGLAYAGLLHAAEVTGDPRYRAYVATRLTAIATVAAHLRAQPAPTPAPTGQARMRAMRNVLEPRALDDCGAMAAGMIKAARSGIAPDLLRPCIDNYLQWIRTGQFRLADGTLARIRPLPDTLWLDDLYMSVPALAQMGVLTGDRAYFDDAVRQIVQFAARMFVPEKNLWRHGWVQAMEPHPAFHWGRANGWAVVAMAELLSVLPADHPGYGEVLKLYRAHASGLAATQDKTGRWHQLLDRNDSYLETSASALFVYALARGINRGWLDRNAYGPMVSLGWNAVAQQVNAQGQVEQVCIGTGMGFDPAFYCYRPVSVYAAHGYGAVLHAGAEMLTLRQNHGSGANINDGALNFGAPTSLH